MFDSRPGAVNPMNDLVGAKAERVSDAIDRQKELLHSAVDMIDSQTDQLRRIFDRSLGIYSGTKIDPPAAPTPPFDSTSVNDWLGYLERACRDLANQTARVREQLP